MYWSSWTRRTAALTIAAACASTAVAAQRNPLFLTATNTSANGAGNYLAVIDTVTQEVTYVPTGGAGGVSGNAGGVAVNGEMAAVINFGSSNVTIFMRTGKTMQPTQTIKTASPPVSVAFGHGHLIVLESKMAESFAVYGNSVTATADGSATLIKGDGTSGQIVSYNGGAAYTETSGSIGELTVSTNGFPGLNGPSLSVPLPAAPNNNTPLGLIGRGANLYVTIAHSDLEALVVNGKITSMATGPTPFMDASGNLLHAPCWNALDGQFLFSSDSPGKQILRYLVSDSNVFFDKAAVATFSGAPTDLAAVDGLLGVIDGGSGSGANASIFTISSEGELTLKFTMRIPSPINGAAIIE